MRTPAGKECRFYYEDYNRGRAVQECRLLKGEEGHRWRPRLCSHCPVPAIQLANGCPNMVLTARVAWRPLLSRQVKVSAFCTLANEPVVDPMIGCGRCHGERWESLREKLDLG
jgi:hypothetical protein